MGDTENPAECATLLPTSDITDTWQPDQQVEDETLHLGLLPKSISSDIDILTENLPLFESHIKLAVCNILHYLTLLQHTLNVHKIAPPPFDVKPMTIVAEKPLSSSTPGKPKRFSSPAPSDAINQHDNSLLTKTYTPPTKVMADQKSYISAKKDKWKFRSVSSATSSTYLYDENEIEGDSSPKSTRSNSILKKREFAPKRVKEEHAKDVSLEDLFNTDPESRRSLERSHSLEARKSKSALRGSREAKKKELNKDKEKDKEKGKERLKSVARKPPQTGGTVTVTSNSANSGIDSAIPPLPTAHRATPVSVSHPLINAAADRRHKEGAVDEAPTPVSSAVTTTSASPGYKILGNGFALKLVLNLFTYTGQLWTNLSELNQLVVITSDTGSNSSELPAPASPRSSPNSSTSGTSKKQKAKSHKTSKIGHYMNAEQESAVKLAFLYSEIKAVMDNSQYIHKPSKRKIHLLRNLNQIASFGKATWISDELQSWIRAIETSLKNGILELIRLTSDDVRKFFEILDSIKKTDKSSNPSTSDGISSNTSNSSSKLLKGPDEIKETKEADTEQKDKLEEEEEYDEDPLYDYDSNTSNNNSKQKRVREEAELNELLQSMKMIFIRIRDLICDCKAQLQIQKARVVNSGNVRNSIEDSSSTGGRTKSDSVGSDGNIIFGLDRQFSIQLLQSLKEIKQSLEKPLIQRYGTVNISPPNPNATIGDDDGDGPFISEFDGALASSLKNITALGAAVRFALEGHLIPFETELANLSTIPRLILASLKQEHAIRLAKNKALNKKKQQQAQQQQSQSQAQSQTQTQSLSQSQQQSPSQTQPQQPQAQLQNEVSSISAPTRRPSSQQLPIPSSIAATSTTTTTATTTTTTTSSTAGLLTRKHSRSIKSAPPSTVQIQAVAQQGQLKPQQAQQSQPIQTVQQPQQPQQSQQLTQQPGPPPPASDLSPFLLVDGTIDATAFVDHFDRQLNINYDLLEKLDLTILRHRIKSLIHEIDQIHEENVPQLLTRVLCTKLCKLREDLDRMKDSLNDLIWTLESHLSFCQSVLENVHLDLFNTNRVKKSVIFNKYRKTYEQILNNPAVEIPPLPIKMPPLITVSATGGLLGNEDIEVEVRTEEEFKRLKSVYIQTLSLVEQMEMAVPKKWPQPLPNLSTFNGQPALVVGNTTDFSLILGSYSNYISRMEQLKDTWTFSIRSLYKYKEVTKDLKPEPFTTGSNSPLSSSQSTTVNVNSPHKGGRR